MEQLLKDLVLTFHRENAEQHAAIGAKLDKMNEKLTGLRVKVAIIGATSGLVASLMALAAKAITGD